MLVAYMLGALVACGGTQGGSRPTAAGPSATSAPPVASTAAQQPGQAAASPPQPATLHFAYTGPSAAFTPVWVAQEEGYFREQGLEVTQTSVQPAPGAQALVAGDFQLEATGPQVVDARLGGADLVYVADLVPYFVFDVYAQPEIRTVADLKGGTLGATQAGATTDYAARAFARHVGLELGSDFDLSYNNAMPALVAALQNRQLSAALLSAPSTVQARSLGLQRLVSLAELKLPFMHSAMIARQAWVAENEATARRYLAAYVRGMATAKANPDLAMRAIGKYTQVDDPEQLRESYEFVRDVWPLRPTVSRAAVQAVIDAVPDARGRSLTAEALIYDGLVP
jgi:ABC-type nitrate/sulfonate/bicarbonate transport system substrate-binding protein